MWKIIKQQFGARQVAQLSSFEVFPEPKRAELHARFEFCDENAQILKERVQIVV